MHNLVDKNIENRVKFSRRVLESIVNLFGALECYIHITLSSSKIFILLLKNSISRVLEVITPITFKFRLN